jgi:hypothetical protein
MRGNVYQPDVKVLFDPETLTKTQYIGHKDLKQVWKTCKQFFAETVSEMEKKLLDVEYLKVQENPQSTNIEGTRGLYIGQQNL